VPNIVQLVSVIHEDVTEAYQIEHLKNICKTHIYVQNTSNNSLILNLKLEHKRSNGKCIVQVIVKFANRYFCYAIHFVLYIVYRN